MTTAERLLQQAMQLSSDERELLAIELFATLEKEPGYDEAWEAEIEQRIDDVDSGRTRPIELDDALDIFGHDNDE